MSFFKTSWIDEYLRTNQNLTIFDIGAFDFRDSINFKQTFSSSDVYAFEPYVENINMYSKNAVNAGVKVFNYAITDKNGEVTFYNSTYLNGKEWTCSGSILKPSEKSKKEIHPGLVYNEEGLKVPSYRLDTFCSIHDVKNIDVIHMDIQGAEYYAVKGFGNTIRPKILFCETCEYEIYEGSLTLNDLDTLLLDMGYEIKERLIYDTLYILKN